MARQSHRHARPRNFFHRYPAVPTYPTRPRNYCARRQLRISAPKISASSTVRKVEIQAIALPVSWIGRVRLTEDSRIDRIEVDPVPFDSGTASLSPEGHAQVTHLVQFLTQVPTARVLLTPAVSDGDLAALRRRRLDKEIEGLARGAGLSPIPRRCGFSSSAAIGRLLAGGDPREIWSRRPASISRALARRQTRRASGRDREPRRARSGKPRAAAQRAGQWLPDFIRRPAGTAPSASPDAGPSTRQGALRATTHEPVPAP